MRRRTGAAMADARRKAMPIFDYECESCGLVLENQLVRHYDDEVVCECGDDMIRQLAAVPRHFDHTVNDGYNAPTVLPDSFRPIQVGSGGGRKRTWRNKT